MARQIKKRCKCGCTARITKSVEIMNGFSQHYIKCTNPHCGRIWVESSEFSHEVKKSKLDNENGLIEFVKNLPLEMIKNLKQACDMELAR